MPIAAYRQHFIFVLEMTVWTQRWISCGKLGSRSGLLRRGIRPRIRPRPSSSYRARQRDTAAPCGQSAASWSASIPKRRDNQSKQTRLSSRTNRLTFSVAVTAADDRIFSGLEFHHHGGIRQAVIGADLRQVFIVPISAVTLDVRRRARVKTDAVPGAADPASQTASHT